MENSSDLSFFSDEDLIRIAKEMGVDIYGDCNRLELARKVSDDNVGRIVKFAHRIWRVKKEGEKYYLERLEDENV